ncbi:MAG: alpha-ketoacid dehydrogenase subunit beta [Magnetovibrio sp.]|nr:alpha-ketoacid dehydrogenase subunit beta [Magnetovibrio sp.]|tara:strand:- start:1013 stop:2089 length:1077 start_codon:yes stop_codon:yes gene_type:complete
MSSQAKNISNRILLYGDAILEATDQEMSVDPNVFVIGLDVADHKAILGSTRGLVEKFGPERVITTPLSEDAITGVAIGAAMAGMRPIHIHIRMDFLLLCMNQLINMAAKAHYMYDGQLSVPLVVRVIVGRSWGQGAQHSQSLHSMFMHVPGVKVVAPSNAFDAKGCMISAVRDNNPVVFIEQRHLYYTDALVPKHPYTVEFGKTRTVGKGEDITIVAISAMVIEAMKARELVEEVSISAEVLDPISLVPLDIDTIVASVSRTKRLLVVDNAWTICGAGAEILASVVESLGIKNSIQVSRMGFKHTTCPATPALEKYFYPTPVSIAARAYEMVWPNKPAWAPDAVKAEMAHQLKFRGPF